MRRMILVAALVLPGCQGVVGPFQHRTPERVDDPILPIPEQERRGRDRLPLPEQSPLIGPSAETSTLGPTGR